MSIRLAAQEYRFSDAPPTRLLSNQDPFSGLIPHSRQIVEPVHFGQGRQSKPCCERCHSQRMPIGLVPHEYALSALAPARNPSSADRVSGLIPHSQRIVEPMPFGNGIVPSATNHAIAYGPDDPEKDCADWEYFRASADLQRLLHRPISFSGCSATEKTNLTVAYEMALGMLEVVQRMGVAWQFVNPNSLWIGHNSYQPNFVDPRPRKWMGPFSTSSWNRFFGVVSGLRHQMFDRTCEITCKSSVCGSAGACSLGFMKIRIRHDHADVLPERFPTSDQFKTQFWLAKTILHELLHFGGFDCADKLVWATLAENDGGACPPILIDDWKLLPHKCYGGACAKALAADWPSAALKNIDNFAFLIRNMGMYWSSEVRLRPEFYPPLGSYCQGNCTNVAWP